MIDGCRACGGTGQGYHWNGYRNVPCRACNPERRVPPPFEHPPTFVRREDWPAVRERLRR